MKSERLVYAKRRRLLTPESDDVGMTLRNLFENGDFVSNLRPELAAIAEKV